VLDGAWTGMASAKPKAKLTRGSHGGVSSTTRAEQCQQLHAAASMNICLRSYAV
jgi:hypothetical protein